MTIQQSTTAAELSWIHTELWKVGCSSKPNPRPNLRSIHCQVRVRSTAWLLLLFLCVGYRVWSSWRLCALNLGKGGVCFGCGLDSPAGCGCMLGRSATRLRRLSCIRPVTITAKINTVNETHMIKIVINTIISFGA